MIWACVGPILVIAFQIYYVFDNCEPGVAAIGWNCDNTSDGVNGLLALLTIGWCLFLSPVLFVISLILEIVERRASRGEGPAPEPEIFD